MNQSMKIKYTLLTLAAMTSATSAATIGLNFQDNVNAADSIMLAAETAGAPGVASSNWNNLDTGTGSGGSLEYADSTPVTGATVSWTTDLGAWHLYDGTPPPVGNGDRMWQGYLDAENSSTVTVSGLSFAGSYDVYVYFDGNNGGSSRSSNYAIGAMFASGEDSESTSWASGQNVDKVYQLPVAGGTSGGTFPVAGPNGNEGNYVLLSGITGSSFTLAATPGATPDINRAPINGIQIVEVVPEPSTTALLGLGGLALILRRRK